MFAYTNEIFVLTQRKKEYEVLKLKLDGSTKQHLVDMFNDCISTFEEKTDKVQFQLGYTLDEDESFVIGGYSLLDQIRTAIDTSDLIDNYRPNSTDGLTESGKEVKAIFIATKSGDKYLAAFQKFERRQIVKKTRNVILFDQDTFKEMKQFAITLGSSISCYFDGDDLSFFEYKDANRVFDLSEYYRIATQEDVEKFKNSLQFALVDDESFDKITTSSTVRKKIAKIMDSGILDIYSASQLKDKAMDLSVELELSADGEKIILPTETKKLKNVLAFLNEQVFKGNLTGTKYYTNSTRVQE